MANQHCFSMDMKMLNCFFLVWLYHTCNYLSDHLSVSYLLLFSQLEARAAAALEKVVDALGVRHLMGLLASRAPCLASLLTRSKDKRNDQRGQAIASLGVCEREIETPRGQEERSERRRRRDQQPEQPISRLDFISSHLCTLPSYIEGNLKQLKQF